MLLQFVVEGSQGRAVVEVGDDAVSVTAHDLVGHQLDQLVDRGTPTAGAIESVLKGTGICPIRAWLALEKAIFERDHPTVSMSAKKTLSETLKNLPY